MRYSIIILAVLIQGCSLRDVRDAPWDPKPGQSLLDQIPNEVGGANRWCGGHMTREQQRQTGKSPRC
jgi:hypothetical protein